MSTAMRAKVWLSQAKESRNEDGELLGENLYFNAVARNDGYDETGDDENNTYAKFSPSADFHIYVANPSLWGKFHVGEEYYVDFTPAE